VVQNVDYLFYYNFVHYKFITLNHKYMWAIFHHTYAKDALLDTSVIFIVVSISGHNTPKTKQMCIAVSTF
jgi:hypothetical protein